VNAPLPTGKLPAALLAELLGEGVSDPAVRIGPAIGEDACAIDVPQGTLIAATDPITLGAGADIGAFAVAINANDVAVMGVRPRWFMATLLLPVGTTGAQVRSLFASLRDALRNTGATLVGGHTEITPVVSQPVVVGQMMGFSASGRIAPTAGVRPGDIVVQVGAAPIEAAVVLADLAPRTVPGLDRARAALRDPGISVVAPALLAAECGATALHDPTEGGLSTGLHELAGASGVSLEIDADAILWFEPGVEICRALGANSWGALASGTLLATFPAERADAAIRSIGAAGFAASRIGIARSGLGVRFRDGRPLPEFERDEVARLSDR